MKAVVQHALLVGLGLLIGLVLLEGGLRVAALVLPQRLERTGVGSTSSGPDDAVILCVGDSHTYGVGVAPDDAYPAQLERALRRHGVKARAVNAGVPGRNTAMLLEALGATIDRYRPAVVVVWAGANNQWAPLDHAGRPEPRLRDRVRLFRLVRLLLGRYEGVSGDFRADLEAALAHADGAVPAGRPATRTLRADDATAEMTRRDLGTSVDVVRRARAVPLLVTYPVTLTSALVAVDEAIVSAGAARATRVVDTSVVARRHRTRHGSLLLPDMHPNARLYRAIGWEIARVLVRERLLDARAAAPRALHVPRTDPTED